MLWRTPTLSIILSLIPEVMANSSCSDRFGGVLRKPGSVHDYNGHGNQYDRSDPEARVTDC
jgi:hypothetical protein